MNPFELARVIKEIGIPAGAFGLCAWMTIIIVKRLSASIDKLVSRMEVFTSRVRDEHDRSKEHHEALMKQHGEMIQTLGRINGWRHDKD